MAPIALTIAGSDPSGGAGIQADLKTFCAFQVYGAAALTALTSQNTQGVNDVHTPPPEFVAKQLDTVLADVPVDAAKTGMLASAAIVEAVAEVLRERPIPRLVVDPVMRSKHGAPLLPDDAVDALTRHILPLAEILTPNLHEAAALTGKLVRSLEEMKEAARRIHDMGPRHVLIKGGHLGDDTPEAVDVLYDGETFEEYARQRLDATHTHGTGCTLSAALAALRARDMAVEPAVAVAKDYITGAIHSAYIVGQGISPVDHLWRLPPLDL